MADPVRTTDLPGVDLSALSQWMDAALPGERQGELSGSVIAGGKSNLTYRIGDGIHVWALRRPPLAHVLPTAHDMAREYRVITALAETAVGVPRRVALCPDPDVLGAPFYLMQWVDGVVLDRPEVIGGVTPEVAGRACAQVVDTLVALHAIDPAEVGLADFGRPDGFLARQLTRWHAQWRASATVPRPALDAVVDALTARLPAPAPGAIVHGDYRLTNVMFTPDLARIAAVVDWEMATLGDPLTDIGLLVVYQTLAATNDLVMPLMRPDDGFLTPKQCADRYAAGSGRDLGDLGWYVGFGYFKLAVVAEGIHHRYLAGQTVGAGFAHFGAAVPVLLDAALAALAG